MLIDYNVHTEELFSCSPCGPPSPPHEVERVKAFIQDVFPPRDSSPDRCPPRFTTLFVPSHDEEGVNRAAPLFHPINIETPQGQNIFTYNHQCRKLKSIREAQLENEALQVNLENNKRQLKWTAVGFVAGLAVTIAGIALFVLGKTSAHVFVAIGKGVLALGGFGGMVASSFKVRTLYRKVYRDFGQVSETLRNQEARQMEGIQMQMSVIQADSRKSSVRLTEQLFKAWFPDDHNIPCCKHPTLDYNANHYT